MLIDTKTEKLVTLSDARNAFPPGRRSLATIMRWVLKGVHGVKLETIMIGGRRLTSTAAMDRFIVAQNPDESPAPEITASQRKRQSLAARAELGRAGV